MQNPVILALLGGIFTSFLNLLGALLVLIWRNPSQRFMDGALGFSAGVMIAASFTSLIIPGIEMGGVWPVIIGIVLGAIMMDLTDHLLPHEHFVMGKEGPVDAEWARKIRGVWLFIIAITLHNMPEGLAVGVTFGSGHYKEALEVMFAIGLQNIPEGLAVSLAAISAGFGNTFYAVYTGIRSGLVEIPLALLGAVAVYYMQTILPYAMGFAAGAMLYVVSDEIIPETHIKGHERVATWGVMIGLIVMLTLDVLLG
ncbi:MAG: ZIP family metal transporter [Thermotogae bacterium]|nr:ZIP family metal transporter [Thermotogota bacterium]